MGGGVLGGPPLPGPLRVGRCFPTPAGAPDPHLAVWLPGKWDPQRLQSQPRAGKRTSSQRGRPELFLCLPIT